MTPQAYADALAGGQPVAYHEDFCVAPKTLGLFPCDCGAVQELRRLQGMASALANVQQAAEGSAEGGGDEGMSEQDSYGPCQRCGLGPRTLIHRPAEFDDMEGAEDCHPYLPPEPEKEKR